MDEKVEEKRFCYDVNIDDNIDIDNDNDNDNDSANQHKIRCGSTVVGERRWRVAETGDGYRYS
jgi:hypothetical protein